MLSQFDNLITDRTQADVAYLRGLIAKGWDAMTPEEWEWFLNGVHKGAYEASDLNRVTAAVNALVAEFRREGTVVPNRKIEIEHAGASRLPEGYTELEYIQSTGTQYVDTGVQPNQDTSVFCEGAFSSSVEGLINPYGAWNSTLQSAMIFLFDSSFNTFAFYGSNQVQGSVTDQNRHVYSNDKNIFKVDEHTIATIPEQSFSCSFCLLIFAYNNGGAPANITVGKLYFCKIYDNGTLSRDFIPCKNESAEVGLYDTVNGVFYRNAGTGTFIEGPEIATQVMDSKLWYKEDQPTDSQMSVYLFNVAALKAEINGETELPFSMVDLTVDGANAIERLLLEVPPFIERLRYSKMYAGEVFAGE